MTYALPTGWQALTNHAQEMRQSSMMSMFEADPARATRYSMTAAGLTLDYSKNLINAKTLTLFQHLFDAIKLQPSIDAMIAGEPINRTENRAALHTLLRTSPGQVSPQLTDQYGAVQASLASVKRISDAVRSGQWLGATGKTITNILHLGIGGSYLGPRMVDEALSPYDDGQIRCDYVANVDGLHIDQVLARLDPTRTLVIIVSKSFSTVETRVNAESTQRWLRQAIPTAQLNLHAVAITSNVAAAQAFGIADENILPMWDWVGGRYSLWSAVSLPIAIKFGFAHFQALLRGAESMDTHFRSASWPNNMPMMLAALGVFYRNFMDVGSHAILPYDHSLRLLPAHLQQLDMESNGKSVSVEGDHVSIQTGPTIWGGEGTNGQHAFHQLLHQGTHFTSLDFILPLTPHHDRQLHHDWLVANCLSQSQALLQGQNLEQLKFEGTESEKMSRVMPGNRPSNTIVMDQLTPATLGATIALYEHKVFCQAQIWQINPFDQWGVELGKKLSETIFEAIDQGAEPTLDPSTRELLSRYQQTRKDRSH
ncbi:glucose-6-phosphate isomerase [Pseudomonadales bacterium]|nr:glucose-6-phosphate isomerase [Pseudomonadales bacterium]